MLGQTKITPVLIDPHLKKSPGTRKSLALAHLSPDSVTDASVPKKIPATSGFTQLFWANNATAMAPQASVWTGLGFRDLGFRVWGSTIWGL